MGLSQIFEIMDTALKKVVAGSCTLTLGAEPHHMNLCDIYQGEMKDGYSALFLTLPGTRLLRDREHPRAVPSWHAL